MDKYHSLIDLLKHAAARLLRWKKSLVLLFVIGVVFYFSLPAVFLEEPFSPVLLDRYGQLLDARVATDQQWRFPPMGEDLPEKYLRCLILFEDQRFFWHLGVDPVAVIRALRQNLTSSTRVSGASTLTMQLVRLWRRAPRNWLNKIWEAFLAVRLEFRYSKKDILRLYAVHAPMGRNVVGAWSASWLYFGRPLGELSWAESALLAVLPNSPSSLNPGSGRKKLLEKRNRLLERLCAKEVIDPLTRDLALAEDLPSERIGQRNRHAVHLLDTLFGSFQKEGRGVPLFHSTIDEDLQERAERVLIRHQQKLSKMLIHDICALIVDHEQGEVIAYLGNAAYLSGGRDQSAWLDLIHRQRSTGSILKPFLYASMLQEGELTPLQLVEDIPTFIRGFSPQNFNRTYLGSVPAHSALAYSLNIPAVRMLKRHGLQRFYDRLLDLGMDSLQRPAEEYGLTLILGGAEGTPWNMAELYSHLAQAALGNKPPQVMNLLRDPVRLDSGAWPINRAASWLTLQALTELARPGLESHWQSFTSSRTLSWKTGTSQGFRDAWALGVTPQHTVAVWCGNASGEGRPEISGLNVAAPVLFDLFQLLPAAEPFPSPWGELRTVTLCRDSGYLPGPYCHDTVETVIPLTSPYRSVCPYHQRVFLDKSGQYRVDSRCEEPFNIRPVDRFVLPPVQAFYTSRWQPDYQPLPPWREDCAVYAEDREIMNLIYPPPGGMVYVPVQLDGQRGAVIFRLIHRHPERVVFWHLDEEYLGTTRHFHEMALDPGPGAHTVTLVDEGGAICQRSFRVIDKKEN